LTLKRDESDGNRLLTEKQFEKPLGTEGCPGEVLDPAVLHTSDGLCTTRPATHTSLPSWLQSDAPGLTGDDASKVWSEPWPEP